MLPCLLWGGGTRSVAGGYEPGPLFFFTKRKNRSLQKQEAGNESYWHYVNEAVGLECRWQSACGKDRRKVRRGPARLSSAGTAQGVGKLWGRGLGCGGVGASLPWHDQPQAVLGQGGREEAARAAEDRETECFLWMQ